MIGCPGTGDGNDNAGNDNGGEQRTLTVDLSSDVEVPACDGSTASGTATLTIDEDAGTITVEIAADGLTTRVTAAHLHMGVAGVAGDVVCTLLSEATEPTDGAITIEGTCPGEGEADFDTLHDAINTDQIYVNVHTDLCPSGEIRGDVISSEAGGE